jgi:hypothetical protein
MKYADTNHHKTLEPECARTFRGIHPYMVYTPCPCSKRLSIRAQKGSQSVLKKALKRLSKGSQRALKGLSKGSQRALKRLSKGPVFVL